MEISIMAEKDNIPQNEIRNGDNEIDWVIPNGLNQTVYHFIQLLDRMYSPAVKKKKPLMIISVLSLWRG